MIEAGTKNMSSFHLAGIVPIAGQKLDFDFPWHDCLQPINKNYLAAERAVLECAYAGCETIWMICREQDLLQREREEKSQYTMFRSIPKIETKEIA